MACIDCPRCEGSSNAIRSITSTSPCSTTFPFSECCASPIVYTVVASLVGQAKPAHLARLQALHRIVVPSERDAEVLASWGFTNYSVVRSAPDRDGLHPTFLPLEREMTLLMASAPWSKQQFDEKGIDVLLETASRLPDLRLILLWRGLFAEDLAARVRARGLDNRVEVVNAKVDAGAYLRRAHATVLLAKRAEIIKAYPHSLIEIAVRRKAGGHEQYYCHGRFRAATTLRTGPGAAGCRFARGCSF